MVTIDLMSDIDCVTETFTLVLETFNGESSFYYLVFTFPGSSGRTG